MKLNLFYVDKVRVAALAVGRTARDNNRVAFLYQTALFRDFFCEVEENINRGVFVRDCRQNAPAKRQLTVSVDIRRNPDNIDIGTETGNLTRRAARTGTYDDCAGF